MIQFTRGERKRGRLTETDSEKKKWRVGAPTDLKVSSLFTRMLRMLASLAKFLSQLRIH